MWDRFNPKEFYNEVAEKYPEERIVYSTLEGIVRKKFILSRLSSFEGTLLDIGCNVGTYLKEYHNGPKIGVDLADKIIEKAKLNVPEATFYVGSAENLDFIKSQSVDVVLCTEVLEHIEHPLEALKEFYRVLKKDGYLLLTVPNALDEHNEDWIVSEVIVEYGIELQEYYHTAYQPDALKELGEKAGFLVVEHGSFCKDVIVPRAAVNNLYYLIYRLKSLMRKMRILSGSNRINYRTFWNAQIMIHRWLGFLKINSWLLPNIREGLNSYIVGRKAS